MPLSNKWNRNRDRFKTAPVAYLLSTSSATDRQACAQRRRGSTLKPPEVAMDKPRHPQVTRPWKTQQTQTNKWRASRTTEAQRQHSKKFSTPQHK